MIYKAEHDPALAYFSSFLILSHCILIQPHWPSFKFSNMPNSLHLLSSWLQLLFFLFSYGWLLLNSSNLTKYDFCKEAFPNLQSKHCSPVLVIEQFVIKQFV